jgi:dipeptidyl aminopeptidase/acylaminoacyl peptidase
VVVASNHLDDWALYRASPGVSGDFAPVVKMDGSLWDPAVSSGGAVAFVHQRDGAIWVSPSPGDEPRALVEEPGDKGWLSFSPDGRHLAYTSDLSERYEVYVVDYPEARARRQVSADGGRAPRWSRDGRELYFVRGGDLMAVAVEEHGGSLTFGEPARLIDTDIVGLHYPFDVAPDGRFVAILEDPEAAPNRIHVVFNWFEELDRLVPPR